MKDWKKKAINFAIKVYSQAVKDLKDMPQEEILRYIVDRSLEHGLCYFVGKHGLASYEEMGALVGRYSTIDELWYVCQTPAQVNFDKEGTILSLKTRLEILKTIKKCQNQS